MKRIQALIAAFIITGIVGVGMLAIGTAILVNPDQVAASDSPAANADSNTAAIVPEAIGSASTSQTQALVAQYQAREKQYQAQLDQLAAQVQADESILAALQLRGIIRINPDGSVQLLRSGGRDAR